MWDWRPIAVKQQSVCVCVWRARVVTVIKVKTLLRQGVVGVGRGSPRLKTVCLWDHASLSQCPSVSTALPHYQPPNPVLCLTAASNLITMSIGQHSSASLLPFNPVLCLTAASNLITTSIGQHSSASLLPFNPVLCPTAASAPSHLSADQDTVAVWVWIHRQTNEGLQSNTTTAETLTTTSGVHTSRHLSTTWDTSPRPRSRPAA